MTATTTGHPTDTRSPSGRQRFRWHPFHLLYPVAALAAMVIAQGPVRDPDVYWHVRFGRELLRTHSFAGASKGWSLVPPADHWTSSEWLAEVILHGFVSWFGWQGMLVFQGIVVAALLVAIAAVIRPSTDPRTRAVVYAVTVMALSPFFQARPQTLSLIFLAGLGAVCRRILLDRALPNPALLFVSVLLWAQLHGLWLLAPAFIVLAALVRLLDDHSKAELRFVGRAIALSVGALAVGCLNPVGIRSLTLPFTLHGATASISEWQPTTIMPYFTWGLLALAWMQIYAWTRRVAPVARAEMTWTAVLLVFAFLANRNVAVALLLLAPVVATRLDRPRVFHTSPREGRLLAAGVVALSLVAVLTDALFAGTARPIPTTSPTRLAAALRDGSPHRVLNDYNVGGIVLAFGGPQVRVGIDGRADYYGGAYIERYNDMLRMRAGWQTLFHRLDPDAAIIDAKSPMAEWLTEHGWRRAGTQGKYVLILRDGSGLSLASAAAG